MKPSRGPADACLWHVEVVHKDDALLAHWRAVHALATLVQLAINDVLCSSYRKHKNDGVRTCSQAMYRAQRQGRRTGSLQARTMRHTGSSMYFAANICYCLNCARGSPHGSQALHSSAHGARVTKQCPMIHGACFTELRPVIHGARLTELCPAGYRAHSTTAHGAPPKSS